MKPLDVTVDGSSPEWSDTAIDALVAWAVDLAERDIAETVEAEGGE